MRPHAHFLGGALTLAAVLFASPAPAQQSAAPSAAQPASAQSSTLQTTLANDVSTLSDKFTGLARVMAGKYDWRPGQGVRSVGDVFNLIVMENKMLTGLLTSAPSAAAGAWAAAAIRLRILQRYRMPCARPTMR